MSQLTLDLYRNQMQARMDLAFRFGRCQGLMESLARHIRDVRALLLEDQLDTADVRFLDLTLSRVDAFIAEETDRTRAVFHHQPETEEAE